LSWWLPWIGTVGLGAFLAFRTDLAGISRAALGASPVWMTLAVALYGLDRMIAAAKWRMLFTINGSSRMTVPRALSIYLRAGFLGSVFPSTVGMDAIRIHLARREGRVSLSHSGGSVIVERWLGVFGLIVVAGAGLGLFGPRERWLDVGAALLVVCAVVLLALIFFVSTPMRARQHSRYWIERMLRFVGELQKSVRAYSDQPGLLLAVFGLALVQHGLLIVINWILALALGLSLPLTLFLWLWPLVLIAIRLPLSVLGFGVREALLYGYFVAGGLPPEEAVTLGLLSGALDVLFIGLGGILTLSGSPLRLGRVPTGESPAP